MVRSTMTFTCLTSIYFIFSFQCEHQVIISAPPTKAKKKTTYVQSQRKRRRPQLQRKQICKEKYKVGPLGASLIIYPVAQRRTLRHLVPTSHRQNESLLEPTSPHLRRAALKLTGLVWL
jgi:hypothetical protein